MSVLMSIIQKSPNNIFWMVLQLRWGKTLNRHMTTTWFSNENKLGRKHRRYYMCLHGNKMRLFIRWRNDYIIGFTAPAIGPNKSKKLTRLMAPAHNIRGKVWMKNNIHGFTDRQLSTVKPFMLFYIQTLPRLLCASAISRVGFLDLFGPIAGAINPVM